MLVALTMVGRRFMLAGHERPGEDPARETDPAFVAWTAASVRTGEFLKANPHTSVNHPAYISLIAEELTAFEIYLSTRRFPTQKETSERERLRSLLAGIDAKKYSG